ncbi:MAG TPA: hypothetical protein VGI93_08850 [Steroidobacteraceae bacterium]
MIRSFLRLNTELLGVEPRRRSELLERLLARGEAISGASDWRALGFRALSPAPMPAVAAVSFLASQAHAAQPAPADFTWVFMATPVHLEPGLDNVRLPSDGIVCLSDEEARELAQEFERLWVDTPFRLQAMEGSLHVLSRTPAPASTHDPSAFAGEHIDEYLPVGAGARFLKALMSEIEMWLFEHPLNRERGRLGRSIVSGLWLWGGGERLEQLPATDFRAEGTDALFGAFDQAGQDTRVVVASHPPGSAEWQAGEEPWLRACVAGLKGDDSLVISLGRRLLQIKGRRTWRLFQKIRAWWEYFE